MVAQHCRCNWCCLIMIKVVNCVMKGEVKLLSRVRLFATPRTVAYQALRSLSVHGVFQARVLEWVPIWYKWPTATRGRIDVSQSRVLVCLKYFIAWIYISISCSRGRLGESVFLGKVSQDKQGSVCESLGRVRLCDPMGCSPPGSSVHGILHAGILEWVVMPSSRGSFWPRDQTHVSYISWIGRWILYRCFHFFI